MRTLTDEEIQKLEKKANEIRQDVIESLMEAGSGHTAGSLGMVDIMTVLYFKMLRHDPQKPDWPDRDRLILSNGHICPALYAVMAHAGYFPKNELKTLRKLGSRLQGHPHRGELPGIETTSGPLGSGLSQAIGMALADRIDNGRSSGKFFYCLLGDGELNEGQNWEAAMLAAKKQIHNLIAIVDRNNIQIDGFTEEVMPLDSLAEKFESFKWHVIEIGGHDLEAIEEAVLEAQAVFDRPSVIIAHTIPGRGVRDFERKPEWHGKPPSQDEAHAALKELKTLGGRIESPQND